MSCCHYYQFSDGHEQAFAVDVSSITFGPGVLAELGDHALGLGLRRIALITDRWLKSTSHLSVALASLKRAGVAGVGCDDTDVGQLVEGAFLQQRLLNNAPCATDRDSLAGIYRDAMRYW